MSLTPAIFLDRDGVINKDPSNADTMGTEDCKEVLSVDDIELYPEVHDFLEKAHSNGYKILVITNQSKVNRGLITVSGLHDIHNHINKLLRDKIHAFYFCPHTKSEVCDCRKPNTGMMKAAMKDHSIDMSKSWLIGDKTGDIKAGNDMGIKTILVKTGYGGSDNKHEAEPDYVAENLREAGKIIFRP